VLFSPDHSAHIPIVLRGATYYNLNTEGGYEALYRRLTHQPLIQKPELGKIRPMPPLPRKQPTHEQPSSDTRTGTSHEDAERVSDGKGDVPSARTPVTASRPHGASRPARQPFEPEMILIPAGEFLMGSDPQKDRYADDDEEPLHILYLPDYDLAKTPVTNAQFAAFMQATGYKQPGDSAETEPPLGQPDHPVVRATWDDAMAYCRWLCEVTGKAYSLPSEAEWEKGARGTDGRIYPWGNQWDAMRGNCGEGGQGDITAVGAYLKGASPYGLLDMAGNVREWTRSLWGNRWEKPDYRYPYMTTDGREDLTTREGLRRVVRGGAFNSGPRSVRCACRGRFPPNLRLRDIGFRVVVHP
jgi:formylglycine-generating enzyme required for sulfatase activity